MKLHFIIVLVHPLRSTCVTISSGSFVIPFVFPLSCNCTTNVTTGEYTCIILSVIHSIIMYIPMYVCTTGSSACVSTLKNGPINIRKAADSFLQ